MSETLPPCPQSGWERQYYEDIEASYGGVIFDSRSLQDAIWNRLKKVHRNQNVAIATGRVNGQFIQDGTKRT